MKSHARVVIIGGGINGCSLAYHLTKIPGWNDIVLVEKDELTSGSTWLAAGNVVQYFNNRAGARLHQYSIELYQNLEKETGQSTGWHTTGSLRLAQTKARLDEYKHVLSKDHNLGLECHLVTPDEMKKLFPYMHTDGLVGGLHHVVDGHCDPAGTTQALATGARMGGAEIVRFNRVTNILQKPNGEWLVQTEKGDITCEVVVNAAGLWADQIAAMVGVYLPIIPMEHHHLMFEHLPEVAEAGEIISVRDPDVPFYLRKEMDTFLVGPYEAKCKAWKPHCVPWDFHQADLPTDLERIQDYIMELLERVPMLQESGMKHIVNGPITYTPDSAQLLGPVYGLRNFYSMAGCNFGITQAGGVGKYLAEWIVYGEPSIDLASLDPRRFGTWTSKKYTLEKVHEAYRMQYQLSAPDTQREAGRPIKTTPVYDLQKQAGAIFESRYGWERAAWFVPEGVEPVDTYSFRRDNSYFKYVGEEAKGCRDRVGLYELSSFAKYMVSGPGAEAYLNHLTSGRLPKIGRVGYNVMCTPKGFIGEDMTIARLAADRFYVVTAAGSEHKCLQHLEEHQPKDGSVTVENVTMKYGVLAVIGPKSRDLLSRITESDLSNQAFPYYSYQDILVGYSPVKALRVNFAGELGWELHVETQFMRSVYLDIQEAGKEFGLVNCGLRAVLNSMRLEKGYLMAGDICGEETPLQAGLDFFVKFDKGDFVGREALLKQKEEGLPSKMVFMTVEADDADAYGDEAIWSGGQVVGRVTSGGYGHRVDKSIAFGFVKPEYAKPGTALEIEILNDRRKATVLEAPVYDPMNEKLRA